MNISFKFISKSPIDKPEYNGLASTRRQAIIWTNANLVYWCIYASLGLNNVRLPYTEDGELPKCQLC